MRIILAGPKASGKTTLGTALAKKLGIPYIDVDDIIVAMFNEEGTAGETCAEIYRQVGRMKFRSVERLAVAAAAEKDWCIIATGGSTMLSPTSRKALRPDSIWFYLEASPDTLWERICQNPKLPAYLEGEQDPRAAFIRRVGLIREVMQATSDYCVDIEDRTPEEIAEEIAENISRELTLRSTSPNTLGEIVRLTTFGESHGPMMGAVLDGVKPGIEISAADIQRELDRRKPGQSKVSTPRKEADAVQIASGVFEGKTTGAPIGLIIPNADHRSHNYDNIKDIFRPGHADFTFWAKYQNRDYRGGGRSSGRETAARVAGGAIARKILAQRGVTIRAHAIEIANVKAESVDYDVIEKNPVRCADSEAAEKMEQAILDARSRCDSVGGVVQLEVEGLPAGLGDPVFSKLDAKLAQAMFSLGAVKGLEIGAGFAASQMTGCENNDPIADGQFQSNNAGGILGGISSGQPIVARVAIKPTPSIAQNQKACDISGQKREIKIEGRHDPCIVPRVIPVIESMVALVLLDCWEIQSRLNPNWPAATEK